jgi:hypothetical protein
MEFDCGFTKENKWFRYRAAAIIIENDCVLFAGNERDNYFYSIGGGVHMGESAEAAVEREVLEETGIPYKIDRLAFLHENFFEGNGSLEGKKIGGQWRFTMKNIEKLFNNGTVSKDIQDNKKQQVLDFIDGVNTDMNGSIQICTIVDCYCDKIESAQQMSNKLIEVINILSEMHGRAINLCNQIAYF